MNLVSPSIEVCLPEALLTDFRWADSLHEGSQVLLRVPADYAEVLRAVPTASEVLAVQRLISLARKVAIVRAIWDEPFWNIVCAKTALFPLLSVLLALPRVEHSVETNGVVRELDVSEVRSAVLEHRLARAAALPSDITLCVEGEGNGLSADLYDPATLGMHPRGYFETLAVEALSTRAVSGSGAQRVYDNAALLGTILAELIENSDLHGRLDSRGRPFRDTGVRGLLFRRVTLSLPVTKPAKHQPKTNEVSCFEASIFDSGIGYFAAYTREPLGPQTELKYEWQVLHNCLERHYHPELSDARPGHRGLGLYEVLRALQALKGRIEFRTGRLYAYRTFLDGELQAQMKPKAPFAHLAWPEPRLLDVDKKYLALPTEHEQLVGASVRILVPLD